MSALIPNKEPETKAKANAEDIFKAVVATLGVILFLNDPTGMILGLLTTWPIGVAVWVVWYISNKSK